MQNGTILKAKDNMDIVRSDAEEDYLESLRRLKQICSELGSDYYDDVKETNDILQIFGN